MTIKEKKKEFILRLHKLINQYEDYCEEERDKVKDYIILKFGELNDVWLLEVSLIEMETRIEYCIGILLGATIINVDYNQLDIKKILKGKVKISDEIEKLKAINYINKIQNQMANSTSEDEFNSTSEEESGMAVVEEINLEESSEVRDN